MKAIHLPPKQRAAAGSDLEAAFRTLWKILAPQAPPPVAQYRFAALRQWRFDFAWPELLVAVEIDGLLRGRGGRHQRMEGFAKDLEKHNAALLLGWLPLRFARSDLDKRPAYVVDQVLAALKMRRSACPT